MRRLRIGIREAEWALGDKNRLDAFCLLLKIKLLFRSSDLKLISYNKCGALLHMDRAKLKRLLEYGSEIGYFDKVINKKGDIRYVARKIHSNQGYSYKLRNDDLTEVSFPALKTLVRRIVMENHIRKQEDTFNTHDKGTMYQALKITNELTHRGIIRKHTRMEDVKIAPEACTNTFSYKDYTGQRIVIDARYRSAFIVKSNTYTIGKDNAIGLSNHGRKLAQKCNLK